MPESQVTQSLEDIYEDLRKEINELPPQSTTEELQRTWDFLQSMQQDEILSFVNVINRMSNEDILKKAEEIEQLAHSLDTIQNQEFLEGERMNFLNR